MQPKAALRNGQPAPAQARSGWIMRFVFRTAGPSSQLIWTAVVEHNQQTRRNSCAHVAGKCQARRQKEPTERIAHMVHVETVARPLAITHARQRPVEAV